MIKKKEWKDKKSYYVIYLTNMYNNKNHKGYIYEVNFRFMFFK